MIKQLLLASVVAVGGLVMSTGVAEAGGPDCHYGHGHGHYSHRPVYVAPVPVYRYPAYSAPHVSHYGPNYGHGYGYGAPAYRSYRPSIGIGVGGGYPYYGSGFGGSPFYGSGFGGYRGGSGFSLYIGR
jgi:hypothetical protein